MAVWVRAGRGSAGGAEGLVVVFGGLGWREERKLESQVGERGRNLVCRAWVRMWLWMWSALPLWVVVVVEGGGIVVVEGGSWRVYRVSRGQLV